MLHVFKMYGRNEDEYDREDAVPAEIATSDGSFEIDFRRVASGPSGGVEMLRINGQRAGFTLLPTRGMGIWRAWVGGRTLGWRSPVRGPVHPSLVPIWDPSGIGWLEGFDELLARCGLESNGAPEFDDQHRLKYPLHGRVANLPAESLQIAVDSEAGTIEVRGVVRETRLFFANLTLTSTVRMHVAGDSIEIVDTVTNGSDRPAIHQMLYHINIGAPLLGDGASLVVPASEVVPKTPRAAEGIDSFRTYGPPQTGFAEQVYLMRMHSDAERWTRALLRSADGEGGLGLAYDTSTLPYFIQWKNTGGERDGYVTGMEPATNFPNTRSFEESQGRVVHLQPQQSVTYQLQLHLLSGRSAVEAFAASVRQVGSQGPEVAREPKEDWCQ